MTTDERLALLACALKTTSVAQQTPHGAWIFQDPRWGDRVFRIDAELLDRALPEELEQTGCHAGRRLPGMRGDAGIVVRALAIGQGRITYRSVKKGDIDLLY